MHRALARACLGLSLMIGSSACAARYQLRDAELREAHEQDSLARLRVYPSNRTISHYDEDASRTVTVSSEIRQRTDRRVYDRVLSTRTDGAIVQEAELNGAPLLWVTFDRSCLEAACAYGFVRTEDGRYRLLHVPEREGYQSPKVFRGCTLPRHRMSRGNLHALAEANQVYRYVRRRGPKTVFLEVRKDIRKRTKGRRDRDRGVGRST